MKNFRFISLMILLGLCLGIGFNIINPKIIESWLDWGTKEPTIVIPEGGVKSDEWSLATFKLMAELQPDGFVFSPIGLNIILQDLKSLSDEATAKQIQEMSLPSIESAIEQSTPAIGFSQLVVDNQINIHDGAHVYLLPLTSDRTQAFETLHLDMVQSIKNKFDYPITNAMISRDAKLLGFTLILQELNFLYPFQAESGSYIDFQVGQGRSQILDALNVEAPIRHISTDLYDAFALMLKGEVESSKVTCMLIIMPKLDDLADFIKLLDCKALNQIKQALLQAEALGEIHLKIPAFQSMGVTTNLRPLLEKMGLAHLYSADVKFPKLTEESIQLENLWHSANFSVQAGPESLLPKKEAKASPAMMEINRPFIWMVGELSHGECPSLMGSVQSL